MTAIAFDGRYVASDRCETSGQNLSQTKIPKVVIVSGFRGTFVLACAGSALVCELIRRHFDSDGSQAFPDVEKYGAGSICDIYGFAIDESLTIYDVYGDGTLVPMGESFAAMGCAADFLYGALAAGANAMRAVDLANHRVRGCGFGYDVIDTYDVFGILSDEGLDEDADDALQRWLDQPVSEKANVEHTGDD